MCKCVCVCYKLITRKTERGEEEGAWGEALTSLLHARDVACETLLRSGNSFVNIAIVTSGKPSYSVDLDDLLYVNA